MATTRLGGWGGPRAPFGSFAGKEEEITPKGIITRLGGWGGPRMRYGSFAGKEEADVAVSGPSKHEGFRRNVGRLMR
jgi:hypothetical protein